VTTRIGKIVVLGGGTAGWMTAAYVRKAFGNSVEVTVLEAPSIPRIGVGEATVPNLQKVFFDFLGIPEEEWMRETNASYKMGVKFINWRSHGDSAAEPRPFADGLEGGSDRYFHLFGLLPSHEKLPLSHYWNYKEKRSLTDAPFDYSCYREPPVLDRKLAPHHSDGSRLDQLRMAPRRPIAGELPLPVRRAGDGCCPYLG
jgi:tryptophan halogenase